MHYLRSLLLLIPFLATLAVSAQENKMKAVEGVFMIPGHEEELHTRFAARDTALVFYWQNREILLQSESDSVWVNAQEKLGDKPLRIRFRRDSAGLWTRMSLGGAREWWRNDTYQPVSRTEISHTPEHLKPFEGLYQFVGHDFQFLQFYEKDNKLVLKQRWDGEEILFVPETEMDFFSREKPGFSLTFTKDKDGTMSEVLAFTRDRWVRVKAFEPGAEQLRVLSGKYQSADDPDNWLEVIPKGKTLVLKQVWDGKEIVFQPQTDTYYYNSEQGFSLNFIKDKEGKVVQVLVLMKDLFNKVKD